MGTREGIRPIGLSRGQSVCISEVLEGIAEVPKTTAVYRQSDSTSQFNHDQKAFKRR
jgi:hypothetical protein